ncbi:MAG: TrmH family RNA methyltransferase [Bacteroidota bacterium]
MQAISKAKIKLFTSLQAKKYRYRHLKFLIEGKKLLQEAINSAYLPEFVLLREDKTDWWKENYGEKEAFIADQALFSQLSTMQQSEGVMAMLAFPSENFCRPTRRTAMPGLGFVLDSIQDPGNLGTLMRSLDYLGIQDIYLGPGCVDPLNPKVLRSSMGAIFRMNIHVLEQVESFVMQAHDRVLMADMSGKAINEIDIPQDALILIGNEANGVSPKLKSLHLNSIAIPRLGQGESLNASTAAAMIAWEIVR